MQCEAASSLAANMTPKMPCIIRGLLTVVQHVPLPCRIPLYYEAKLLFVVWLWYPSTKGAVSLYTHTLQPLLAAHEATIDQKLADIREILFDSFSANFHKCLLTSLSRTHIRYLQTCRVCWPHRAHMSSGSSATILSPSITIRLHEDQPVLQGDSPHACTVFPAI